jgi:hypothetical protein
MLSNYYKENISLHEQIVADMNTIFNQNRLPILIKKNNSINQLIFMYLPKGNNTYDAIYFDSSYNIVNGSSAQKLFATEIPTTLLRNVSRSIYHAIQADTTGVFFAFKYKNEFSNYEIGVFAPHNSNEVEPGNVISKLSNNFFIYKTIVP